jgi:hypothetical protein
VLRLADNSIVSNEYDYDLLKAEVVELHAEGVDTDDLAIDQKDISQMLTEGMGEMDMSAFTDDIAADIAEKAEENRRKEEEADAASAPISDAFGFKRVTVEQSRAIRQFMAIAETRTGLTGVAALVAYLESVGR